MLSYDKLHFMEYLKTIEYTSKTKRDMSNGNKIEYLDIKMAMDIETTSTFINDGNTKVGFMYIAMVGLQDKVFYVRYWKDYIEMMDIIRKWFMLSPKRRIVCYIHFLGFEFQFMRKELKWIDVFSTDERKPIKALSNQCVEYRDSYILSALPLAKVADNLQKHTIKKMVGDLDYSLVRLPITPLTDKEMGYCENDVLILLAYIDECLDDYTHICDIPLTNTGKVREFCKARCFKKNGRFTTGVYQRYKNTMSRCKFDLLTYQYCKNAFQGGFVHANIYRTDMLLKDVYSMDLTSSYPYSMLSEKYPMSEPHLITDWDIVDNLAFFSIFKVRLYNVRPKFLFENYLSVSKCKDVENAKLNNGRVQSADTLTTYVTNIDWQIMKRDYDFDYEFLSGFWFYMDYLPRALCLSILELYGMKTTLKGVEGKEMEYLKSKGMINSVYGMCVTDIIRDENVYTNENGWECKKKWDKDIEELTKLIDKYNSKRQRFLYYPWGIAVTAYSRINLWSAILSLQEDYIYSDTDSVKFTNYDKHTDYFRRYNDLCDIKLKKMCEYNKLDFALTRPKTIKDVEKPLGVWDYEGKYDYFKTLGAKRYMYYKDGKYQLTLAGLSKQNGMKYIESQGKDIKSTFSVFSDELYIPKDKTGKQTHTYIDSEYSDIPITDYLGNKETISVKSGIHLENADFTLSMTLQYKKSIAELRKGYSIGKDYIDYAPDIVGYDLESED